MRKLPLKAFFAVSAICVVTTASAQQNVVRPIPQTANTYDWNGFYVGAKTGYGWTRKEGSATLLNGAPINPSGPVNYDLGGAFGGVRTGYNFLWKSQFLLGIEGDFSFADIRGGGLNPSRNWQDAAFDWFATVRGRVGYHFNNGLIYGTAGISWVHIYDSITRLPGGISPAPVGTVETSVAARPGWTAGGGIELPLSRNWAVSLEYLLIETNFNHTRAISGTLGQVEYTLHTVSVGVNYKF